MFQKIERSLSVEQIALVGNDLHFSSDKIKLYTKIQMSQTILNKTIHLKRFTGWRNCLPKK